MRTIFLVYSDILKSTKTVSQAEQLSAEIDQLLTSLYHEGKKEFEKALVSIRAEIAQIIKEELISKDPKIENKEMIKEFLTQLKERLQSLKTINLTLAFSPPQQIINNIYEWINKNVGDGYVLDIEVNQDIIGGAKITFQGRYLDLSLKKTLEQVFKNKRKEITKGIE